MNPGSTSERDYLLNQLNAIEKSLQKQFGETYKSAINLGEIRNVINSGDSFSFDKNPSAKKKVDSMLKTLQGNISTFVGDKIETVGRVATQTAKDGVNKQIKPTKSQQKFTDDLINDATKTARQNASESAGEYKLSPQVWNFTDYGKKEIQAMVNAGIRKGLTVQKIADSVLPYLKNPNLEESEPEFQAIKTPKGVYKSAYKNALRMARTEVLRGYDEAEWNSYQNDPMVVGFEIKISNNHTTKQGGKKRPLKDMCDELAGKYPKSFKFTGWHPQCRCTMIPITIGADELGDLMEAEENGETFVSKDAITQLPENFTEWYDANKDRFNTNNEPYFLSENQNIIENGGAVEAPQAPTAEDTQTETETNNNTSSESNSETKIERTVNEFKIKKGLKTFDDYFDSVDKEDLQFYTDIIKNILEENLYDTDALIDALENINCVELKEYALSLASNLKAGNFNEMPWIQIERTEETTAPVVENTATPSEIFNENGYSQERKDNALWDTNVGWDADKALRPQAAAVWNSATRAEKEAIYSYTNAAYRKINPVLEKRSDLRNETEFMEDTNNLTSYIEKSSLQQDMWFQRGDSNLDAIKSRIDFYGGNWDGDLKTLEGQVMQEGGFMSTGSSKGGGFGSTKVIINIFAPKGTAAAYIEPVSACGGEHVDADGKALVDAGGMNWDGKTEQEYIGEDETLFQRGTIMRITKVEEKGGRYFIDCEIIGQEVKDLSYVVRS